MIYREATVADAQAIATLHADSWRSNYRGAYLDSFLDGDVHQDRLQVWQARLSAPAANQFVVVAEVGFWCRANHPNCPLYLWVLEQNERAQRFYSRLGATDRGGEISVPAGGCQISGRRYVWSAVSEVPEVEKT